MNGMRAHSEGQADRSIFPLHNFSAVRTAYDESFVQRMHLLARSTFPTAAVSVSSDAKAARHISRVYPRRYFGIGEKPQTYVERSV